MQEDLPIFLAKAIDWLIPEALGKAHDTRKLSISRAFCAGTSAQQIVTAGSWRSTNTFAKRYFVPVLPKNERVGSGSSLQVLRTIKNWIH